MGFEEINEFIKMVSNADNNLVPGAGIEPAWEFNSRGILSPLRLPISPPGHLKYYLEAEAGIEPAYTALQAAA